MHILLIPHVSANFECENLHPSVMIILDIDMLFRNNINIKPIGLPKF